MKNRIRFEFTGPTNTGTTKIWMVWLLKARDTRVVGCISWEKGLRAYGFRVTSKETLQSHELLTIAGQVASANDFHRSTRRRKR